MICLMFLIANVCGDYKAGTKEGHEPGGSCQWDFTGKTRKPPFTFFHSMKKVKQKNLGKTMLPPTSFRSPRCFAVPARRHRIKFGAII